MNARGKGFVRFFAGVVLAAVLLYAAIWWLTGGIQ